MIVPMKTAVTSIIYELICIVRHLFGLIFTPYYTMRSIALRPSLAQAAVIWTIAIVYLGSLHASRVWFFMLQMGVLCTYFYLATRFFKNPASASRVAVLFSYTLWPTIVWFFTNRAIYHVLPPPRTTSTLGIGFSIFFISFSISILIWKMILFYLAARYSLKQHFWKVVYTIVLYMPIAIALTYIGYVLKISRIPFL